MKACVYEGVRRCYKLCKLFISHACCTAAVTAVNEVALLRVGEAMQEYPIVHLLVEQCMDMWMMDMVCDDRHGVVRCALHMHLFGRLRAPAWRTMLGHVVLRGCPYAFIHLEQQCRSRQHVKRCMHVCAACMRASHAHGLALL